MSRDDLQETSAYGREASGAESTSDEAAGQDPEEIRENIEQTRAEMSETINAIQERLSPDHLKEQVKEQVREQFQEAKETVRQATIGKVDDMVQSASDTVYRTRRSVMTTIRENPIPAAMVGVGLGWLLMSGRGTGSSGRSTYQRSGRGYRASSYTPRPGYGVPGRGAAGATTYGESKSGVVSQAQETASNIANKATSAVSGAVDQAQETASYVADQAQWAGNRVQSAMERNPLAVGAVALAVGAAVGLAIPLSEAENEMMGETRDTLVDKAQTVAQDTMDTVQRVAGRVTEEAQTAIKEETQTSPSTT
jgi:ElaB/YqjD/DUF883 family membrane-anchored ribosome-binding protein